MCASSARNFNWSARTAVLSHSGLPLPYCGPSSDARVTYARYIASRIATVFRVLHHREIRREVQREFVAGLAFAFGRFFRGFDHVFGQAGELRFVAGFDDVGVRVGRIEHVIGKRLRQRRLLFLQFGETRLLVFRQFGAGQAEIAQRIAEDFLALAGQRREIARSRSAPCTFRTARDSGRRSTRIR